MLPKFPGRHEIPAKILSHVHHVLEFWKDRLPTSAEHNAYSIMTLFYETIQGFEETWIDWLGDPAWHRMMTMEKDKEI